MAAQTRLGMWKMQNSNTRSNMAQDVLCRRKTLADNRAKTMVAVLHEARSWFMPALVLVKEIRYTLKN
jgi:hypothetical protein